MKALDSRAPALDLSALLLPSPKGAWWGCAEEAFRGTGQRLERAGATYNVFIIMGAESGN